MTSPAAPAPAPDSGQPLDKVIDAPADASRLPLAADGHRLTLRQTFPVWLRVSLLSFGGPAGQIAVMHRILVDEKKWIGEDRFLHALSYCMLLPGPEAQQLATYIGWLLHRVPGGLLAGLLFILPGFVVIMLLSIVYATWQETILVSALFYGLKPAVMAIVCQAVIRIGRRVLKNTVMICIAAGSFCLICFLGLPFPWLIVLAGLTGTLGARIAPGHFVLADQHHSSSRGPSPLAASVMTLPPAIAPTMRRAVWVSAVCLSVWLIPLLLVRRIAGADSVFWLEGVFFSRTAVVTFGGAYAVLAYIAQEAVENFGWLHPGEMMDGLGMAETTPGPLIMVVQFVGFLGAWRNPGSLSPLVAGMLGATITTWATFAPCFYWIFLGAPYVERLRQSRLLNAVMSTITATVVGVILNLAVWFGLHTLFREVTTMHVGWMRVLIPDPSSVDLVAVLISAAAFGLTFALRTSMVVTLATCCGLGMLATLLM